MLEKQNIRRIKTTYLTQEIEEPKVSRAPGPKLHDDDFELVCRVVAAECRGEPYEGQQAVAQVIYDRLHSTYYGETVEDVLLKPGAFAKPWKGDLGSYPKVIEAVESVFYGGHRVFDDAAYFFFNPVTARPGPVKELRTYTYLGTIGNHEFRGK